MAGQVTRKVEVHREGRWWVAEVVGVPGGATEVRKLADLDAEVRDLLSGLLDADEESFDLEYDFRPAFGEEVAEAWEAFERERDELYELRSRFESDRRNTVLALRDKGVSMRDVAHLMDISHQRVAQLLDA